ncbi:xanthine dehydrogenase family protein molybdopterin-binding subunit [uncultured Gilvimarinus sp.]|uniref:xanthine dehydrogenase family protein molybdopterin-binding subunit n=1 Tax=uncultured Gilvimarinus sp. TaxID=1689143 RepID=UPI0030EB4C30
MAFKSIDYSGTVGKSLVRKSGREKVTGAATFTAEHQPDRMLHAVAVTSNIARGKIKSIDTRAAKNLPGVQAILLPDNVPPFNRIKTFNDSGVKHSLASNVFPAAETEVFYAGQYVAAVIADTFETARDAALLVKVTYETQTHVTNIDDAPADERPESLMGAPAVITKGDDAQQAWQASAVKIEADYRLYGNHHNPIEPHATIAHFGKKNGKPFLTVHDTTQSLAPGQATYAALFDLAPEQVQVICPYVGGAFGSKGAMWPQAVLACLCAKLVDAPVKVVATRQQMYGGTGHRSPFRQRVALGADKDGTIQSIIHTGVASTSRKDIYNEAFTMATRMMYRTHSLHLEQSRCRLDTQLPTFMRAPPETPGLYALEAAVDELATELKMDPIELRIKNEPEVDQHSGKPFSSRLLVDCLQKGAERFGWSKRAAEPRSKRDGHWLIGMGVASATYPHNVFPTQVDVTLNENGTADIACCTQELGTGTRTAQSQLAADMLGLPIKKVNMRLGDTSLPPGGISGGSATTASVGGAIRNAVEKIKEQLLTLAQQQGELKSASLEDIHFAQGAITDGQTRIAMDDLLEQAGKPNLTARGSFKGPEEQKYSPHSYGATFVEVAVDEELGLVRVRRMLGCYACGTILNARTGRSQFIGGMVMGIGHALQEATHWDHRYGRITNDNLAEYHIPVNADIPDLDIMWIDTPDFNASPIGAKGIGEIGITGVAAAVSSAIYNATGKRLRQLPITPEMVMS